MEWMWQVVAMRWLLTFPEDAPSQANYVAWALRGGVHGDILSPADPLPASIDAYAALLLPGGGDVEPALYGAATVHPRVYGVNPAQDARELHLIQVFQAAQKPIFGICRGLQMLNVAFGGELIQHVPDRVPEVQERHRKQDSYDARHGLVWDTATRLGWRLSMAADTNSAHHQAINPDALGRGLQVAARSPGGIVEAVESFSGPAPVVAVQWHPERLPAEHSASRALLDFFCAIARGG